MDKEIINTPGPAEESKAAGQNNQESFGPLIGSEGEVSGYDWD